MRKFCPICGAPLGPEQQCSPCHGTQAVPVAVKPPAAGDLESVVTLPAAPTMRRLGGSGVEFTLYLVLAGILFAVSIPTLGLSDLAITPLILLLIVIRDTNSGALSLAKRLGSMRVVMRDSGLPIGNYQALLRNLYYLIVVAMFIVPLLNIVPMILLVLLMLADTALIIVSHDGRRFGDWLAGTQVVQVEKE